MTPEQIAAYAAAGVALIGATTAFAKFLLTYFKDSAERRDRGSFVPKAQLDKCEEEKDDLRNAAIEFREKILADKGQALSDREEQRQRDRKIIEDKDRSINELGQEISRTKVQLIIVESERDLLKQKHANCEANATGIVDVLRSHPEQTGEALLAILIRQGYLRKEPNQ